MMSPCILQTVLAPIVPLYAAATEPAAGPAIWPFQLGLALWTVAVVAHGWIRARRGGRPDRG